MIQDENLVLSVQEFPLWSKENLMAVFATQEILILIRQDFYTNQAPGVPFTNMVRLKSQHG